MYKTVISLWILILFLVPIQIHGASSSTESVIILFFEELSVDDLGLLPAGSVALLHKKNFSEDQLKEHPIKVVYVTSPLKETLPLLNSLLLNYQVIITSTKQNLNPLWIESSSSGILLSKTTRREGLLQSRDIVDRIHEYYIKNTAAFTNNLIHTDKNFYLKELSQKNLLFHHLYWIRYTLLWIMITLFLIYLFSREAHRKRLISYIILLIPLVSIVYSFRFPKYPHIIITPLGIFIVSVLLAYLYKKTKHPASLFYPWICGITGGLISYCTFFSISTLYYSPIGYNNIIIGGRFYGLNNDMVGILLGSFLSLFMLLWHYELPKIHRIASALLFSCIILLCFSPVYGANGGGLLTAFFSILYCQWVLLPNRRYRFTLILASVLLFYLFQRSIVTWDISQTTSTHLGSFISAIKIHDIQYIYTVLSNKILQVLRFILVPPLNIILFLEVYSILYQRNENGSKEFSITSNIFIFTTIMMNILNDTGMLASILMLLYYILPFYTIESCSNCIFPRFKA